MIHVSMDNFFTVWCNDDIYHYTMSRGWMWGERKKEKYINVYQRLKSAYETNHYSNMGEFMS